VVPVVAALGLAVLLSQPAGPAPARGPGDRFPSAATSYLVAIDGKVVWAREADAPRPPASLTKIMTALLVVEKGWDPDAALLVSRRSASETGSRLGLRAGESIRAGGALTAMLLASANDACMALAEHAEGSERAFVRSMNARAAALGLRATRFENPCGHDAPGQRSSAADLLVLANEAMRHAEIARLVSVASARVSTIAGRAFTVRNGNALIGSFRGAAGIKTGFTPGAGKCLVALAERDGTRVLLVLLDSPDRWWAAAAMLEEAFDAARTGK
jgi:D-alanyl-D-alanine carboxypeptidase (penicillin-binding protein 5/6)